LRNKVAYRNHDVRKDPVDPETTLAIVRGCDEIFAKWGRGVFHRDLRKDQVSDEELLKHFLGRSGTMRAPVLRTPAGIMAGFEESVYRQLLKG
jgi:arsenate reductase-like glutaredoxin family protein